jgi:hypothetical protein
VERDRLYGVGSWFSKTVKRLGSTSRPAQPILCPIVIEASVSLSPAGSLPPDLKPAPALAMASKMFSGRSNGVEKQTPAARVKACYLGTFAR